MQQTEKLSSLPRLKNFDTPDGRMKAEVVTTNQILSWSDERQKNLRTELEYLIPAVFPRMPEKDWRAFVDKFFKCRDNHIQRQVILLRDESGALVAAASYDCGKVEYEGRTVTAVYIIVRAILNTYQSGGLGQLIASKILTELQPDILMVNCYQSASLHSWLRLLQKGVVTGFEVYPRMEQADGKEVLKTLPFKDMDYVMSIFKIMFPYPPERLEKIMKDFTVLMARKNDHEGVYDFQPWEKNGRKDAVAEALGLTNKDGVLVIFKKL